MRACVPNGGIQVERERRGEEGERKTIQVERERRVEDEDTGRENTGGKRRKGKRANKREGRRESNAGGK